MACTWRRAPRALSCLAELPSDRSSRNAHAPAAVVELPRYGIGLTDICKISAGSDHDVGKDVFDVPGLIAALERYRPDWVAFNGKNAAKAALARGVDYGIQAERLGPVKVFVLPSTSGAARGFWDVRFWHELAEIV